MLPGKVLSLILTAILALAAVLLTDCGREEKPPPRQSDTRFNVVLIVSDALRQDVLGCYGGEARTPNLDRLAGRGVLFENAYATSPWTPPSAVTIFTGNYATNYPCSSAARTLQIMVPDEEVLLAEVLRQRGYDTALKNENVQVSLHNCFQGFDVLERSRIADDLTDEARDSIKQITGAEFRGHLQYQHSWHVLARLLSVPEGRNFYLVHWILDPHEPYRPIAEFQQRIVVDKSRLTKPAERYSARKNIKGDLNDEEVRYLKARYMAEVESVDERVGYVFKVLEHRELLESTYFVFTSDHGELFGEHGRFGHGVDYYEELVRVPLIIYGPELPAGKRVETPVSLVDLMATLKDLLGVEYEENMQGQSFKDLVAGRSGKTRPLYFDDVREHTSVDALLDDGFKLVALRDSTYQLYDVVNDPGELNDVAGAHKARVEEMVPKLLAHREASQERLTANLILLEGSGKERLSDQEREELQKKLKSLGYIQ